MQRNSRTAAGRWGWSPPSLFMVTLDNLVVTTALPRIRVDLGARLSGLEWIVNAYTLSFAVLLHDRRGSRRSVRSPAHARDRAWRFSPAPRRRPRSRPAPAR